jgi:hypothetical protein
VSDHTHLDPFDVIVCKNKLGIYECTYKSGKGGEEHVGTVVSVNSNGAKVIVSGKEIFIKSGVLGSSKCSVVNGPDGNVLECE